MMRRNKVIGLFMAVILCSVMFFSLSFLIMEAEHDCVHEHCLICLEMEACISFLSGLGLAVLCPLILFARCLLAVLSGRRVAERFRKDTLVSLKVKLTN